MKYIVKGVGDVELTDKDFLGSGGQGSVWGKNNTAYKIYQDPSQMLPTGKIQELSALTNRNIVKPEHLILGKKNEIVGYTMRLVSGFDLFEFFNRSFQQKHNITQEKLLYFAKELRNLIAHVHEKNILVVDCNEQNFLIDRNFQEIYAIDTDSYQTRSYPATVIMDSIRDRHCKHNQFTQGTDWFSYGILVFQLLIGQHPFRGSHPDFKHLSKNEQMDARMLQNISAFHQNAALSSICSPLDQIPTALKQWMIATFEQGRREAPPQNFKDLITVAAVVKKIVGSKQFKIDHMETYISKILQYFSEHGDRFVVTNKQFHFQKKTYTLPANDVCVSFTAKGNQPLAVYLDNQQVKIFDILKQKEIPFSCNASGMMQTNGRVYLQNGINMLQLEFLEFGTNVQVSAKVVGKVLDVPGTTRIFTGGVLQNLLGRFYVSLFPQAGTCYQIPIPELDHYKIFDAKYENNVLVVIAVTRSGKYDRFVLRFSPEFKTYDCRKVEDNNLLNFTVNDAGICVLIADDNELELFSNRSGSSVSQFSDSQITSNMNLCHDGSKIMFYTDEKLYGFSKNQ